MFFFLALIAIIGGWLVLVPLAIIPLTLIAAWALQPKLRKMVASNQEESAQRTAHLFEVMNGLDIVKSMGANAWARRKWEMLTLHISETSLKLREWTAFGGQLGMTLNGLCTVLLVTVGAWMIANGELTVGQLIAVTMLATRAVTPATQIAALMLRYQQTKLSLTALDQVMEGPTDETPDSVHVTNLRGDLEFRDVHFAYPKSPPLLKGLNLRIAAGERVGFVGRIGSGKSTLLRLLLNLYEPQQGAVLVDHIAANHIDPQSLRRHMGYVPQDVTLFHGSIRENILLGATDVSDADLIQSIRRSCLHETLAQMPEGLGTQVGEGGNCLSGGQRQAVSIARALVRQPKLLLLDEPSSAMDPATEQALIQNLRELQDVTLLLVTHRTSMLPLVDRLVVLDQGRVIFDGPRDEVLRQLQVAAARPTTMVKAKV
jgi:ATP-binding cassette subfamily C protein LapB